LVEEGELDSNPTATLSPPTLKMKPVLVITDDELTVLLKACNGREFADRHDEALIRLLLDCGVWVSEACGLRVDDLDLDQGIAIVLGKGRKRRAIYFSARTVRALDRYVRMRANHRWAHLDALFLTQRGALSPDGARDRVKYRGELAGIDDLHPHRFRHTFAHDFLMSGGQERDLERLAGWSSDVMLERYGATPHACPQPLKMARRPRSSRDLDFPSYLQRCLDDSMRLAALIAAVAAAANLLVLGVLHVVSSEVDPKTRAVSEYALGDFGWLATIMTVAEGVGAIALAVALRRERAPALLLLMFGVIKLAQPLFPVDAVGTPATSAGRVHSVLGILAFFLLPLAALLLFRALRRMGSRLAPGIAVVLAIATVGVLVGNAVGVFGLAQRAYLALCALWVLFAAGAVLRNLRAGLGEPAAVEGRDGAT
jgi:hypothetical protein